MSTALLREQSYALVLYVSGGLSLLAVLTATISLPLVFSYLHHVRRQLTQDLLFCQISAMDTRVELLRMKETVNNSTFEDFLNPPAIRPTREIGHCKPCCLPGEPGRPGLEGRQGVNGAQGASGLPGLTGRSMSSISCRSTVKETQFVNDQKPKHNLRDLLWPKDKKLEKIQIRH